MRIDPGAQGLQALLSLACGGALGLLYDLYTACLRRSRLEKLRVLLYLPYSLLAAVLLFLLGSIAGRAAGSPQNLPRFWRFLPGCCCFP